jgi:diphthine methyl ester synthase
MARGKKKFLPPRFMTVRQAATILLTIHKRRVEAALPVTVTTRTGTVIEVGSPACRAVAVCRVGMATQLIASGTLEELSRADCGPELHSLVLVGETHELEDELLRRFSLHSAATGAFPRPAPADAVGELPPPPGVTLEEAAAASATSEV